MTRSHLNTVARDVAGNAIEGAVIRILQPGTTNVIADPIYDTDVTITPLTNPFTTPSGLVSIYVDTAQRVRVGITPPGAAERFMEDIDVGAVGGGGGGTDVHTGAGTSSTVVGASATSAGTSSLAIAQQAASAGDFSTAAGFQAASAGLSSTALGAQADADGERAVAVGRVAVGTSLGSVALGGNAAATNIRATAVGDTSGANSQFASAFGAQASGGHDHSTAIGAQAATTEPNQVILGTPADVADVPGSLLLTAADGKRGRLRMLPDGSLTTIWHVPSNNANMLPATEQDFETSLGSWAAVSGMAVSQSTDYAHAGTKSMKMVLSGSGAASARSSKVAAVVGTVYVGWARMFYHAGAATASLNGTCWLEFYTAGNVIIGSATAGRTRAYFADSWIWFDVRAVAPATTATVCLRVGLPSGGGANLDAFYADTAGIFSVAGSV